MKLLIILIIFNIYLNQDIINISSFEPFIIPKEKKEITFRYNYMSYEKADIIIYISPILEKQILGKLLFSNLEKRKENQEISEDEKLFELGYNSKFSITINANEKINKGRGYYYITLKGDISSNFEIFLSNEIRNLSISNSYYFPKVYNLSNYLSFQINNLESSYYLNILKYNRTCLDFQIFDGDKMKDCNDEIPQFIELTEKHNYSIKIFYNNTNDDIVFNFVKEIIQDLLFYKNNLLFLDDSEMFFQLSIEDLEIYERIALEIDYGLNAYIKIYYLKERKSPNSIPDEKTMDYLDYKIYNNENIVILNKLFYIYYKFVLIKVHINKNNNYPLKINIIKDIYNIDKIPYNFNIEKGNSLFTINDRLREYYIDIENNFLLKYEYKNIMKVYNFDNKINKDKIYIGELKNIKYISFINYATVGIFSFEIIPYNMNNKLRFNSNFNELSSSFLENSNEYTEIISLTHPAICYLNLIIGNSSFYLLKNNDDYIKYENEISEENKTLLNTFEIINETSVLKIKINYFSLYDYFIQQNDNIFDIINFGKNIKYFRENIKYTILILDFKCLIKLMTPKTQTKIYNENKKYLLDNSHPFVYLDKGDLFTIEGNNSLVSFYYQISNNNKTVICKENMKEYIDINEIFVVFNKTEFNAINIIITYLDNETESINLQYLIDFNIIPYSRYNLKYFDTKEIYNNKSKSILIPNYYKEDNVKHSEEEQLFMYLNFGLNIKKMKIEIKYINYIFLKENENNILPSGFKRIMIGYKSKNYINIDLCKNSKISYSLLKNDIIIPSKQNVTMLSNDILYVENDDNYTESAQDYYSLDIYSDNEILLLLSKHKLDFLNEILYDYKINVEITDKKTKELYVDFNAFSPLPHTEYTLYIIDSKYNLDDHCFIHYLINENLYTYKYDVISNGEEANFEIYMKLENIVEDEKEYSIIIITKQIFLLDIKYNYYQPTKIKFFTEEKKDGKDKDKDKNSSNASVIIPIIIVIILLIGGLFILFNMKKKKKFVKDEKLYEKINELHHLN